MESKEYTFYLSLVSRERSHTYTVSEYLSMIDIPGIYHVLCYHVRDIVTNIILLFV